MNTIKSFKSFQNALQVLVPIFESSGISWKNDEQYDEFDDVAEALFSSFVVKHVETLIGSTKSLNIKYDFGLFTGTEDHYFLVKCANSGIIGRFRKYVTTSEPFDSVEIYIGPSEITIVDADQIDLEFVQCLGKPGQ